MGCNKMKLTVLGAYGPYPAAGGACSGYLLEHEGYTVLIDCGNGVLSRLQQFIEIGELDAVILSHLHSDHISDLFILRYALLFGRERGEIGYPLPVYAPEEPAGEYMRLPYKDVYAVEALAEGHDLVLGPFTFTFLKTEHSIPCYALAVYLGGEKKLVYSADTEYFPALADFARGAGLFLCEANFLEEDLQKGAVNHLTAGQAASLAREADVKTLLLTHLLPFRDPRLYLREAGKTFKDVEIAQEGMIYDLGPVPAVGFDYQVADDAKGSGGLGRPVADEPGRLAYDGAHPMVDKFGGLGRDAGRPAADSAAEPARPEDDPDMDDLPAADEAAEPDPDRFAADASAGKGSPARWRELTVITDSVKASILAGRLEEEEIPVFLKKDEAAGSIYGLTVGPLANIRIYVPPSKIEQAHRLLEEIERQ